MPLPTTPKSRRPSLQTPFQQPIVEVYSDSRSHGPQGPSRHVRIAQASSQGGGAIAKSEDGLRCVVAGRDSLRILRVSEPGMAHSAEHKSSVGRDGYRIDASRNLWTSSGLKIDSASTDVVWGHGNFSSKILTSARNGELIMWDLNKSGPTKYERRVRQHVRSIHKIAYSTVLRDYVITASADGDIRVWDLRVLTDCVMKIRHPAAVRSVVFSPVQWQPRHAVTGLDNGNIYRWDLNMGQRGQLDRIPLAHSGPILALDWTYSATSSLSSNTRDSGSIGLPRGSNWYSNVGVGLFDDLSGNAPPASEVEGANSGAGWLASGGLDRRVKIWNMTPKSDDAHISRKALYTMHTSFPVRCVKWRSGYECELAVTSYQDVAPTTQLNQSIDFAATGLGLASSSPKANLLSHATASEEPEEQNIPMLANAGGSNPIEIWDVRRGYVAKWTVRGSAAEGGVTDVAFADSHTLWAQHYSGAFSQLDLRYCVRTLDAIPRTATTWDPTGALVFVADRPKQWEVPYDDINPEKRTQLKRRVKTLGNKPYSPISQSMGIMTGHALTDDIEQFAKMAYGYVYEGGDKITLCSRNADVAIDVGKYDAAQTWLLLASLLNDVVTQTFNTPAIALSPLPLLNPKLAHSMSAPASIPTIAHIHGPPNPVRAHSEDVHTHVDDLASPGIKPMSPSVATSRRDGEKSRIKSTSSAGTGFPSPLRTTPASSTTPSPHRTATPLPSLPGSLSTTVLGRRPSSAGLPPTFGSVPPPALRSRLGSSFRRPSFKGSGLSSLAGGEPRSFSHSSLKHVGEGALDDDDSDSGGSEHDLQSSAISEIEVPFAREEPEVERVPSRSRRPSSGAMPHWQSRASSVQPSPLSRVAVQETWTEDERDEDDSPSPASTDSDLSSGELEDLTASGLRPPHPLSRRQSSSRQRRSSMQSSKKSRSRSSTVASLSVSLPPPAMRSHSRLVRQESYSSMKTVTASQTPTSMHGVDRLYGGEHDSSTALQRDASRDISTIVPARYDAVSLKSTPYYSRSRPRSEAYSNDDYTEADRNHPVMGKIPSTATITASETLARERIYETEARLREAGWEAMRETLEILVDEGDIQMCAMLALIASEELKVGKGRMLRFIESYIDLLTRLRLHGPAAYIRKYSSSEVVREKTQTGTTIETVCAKCRKPLLQSAAKVSNGGRPSGDFAFCLKCKASTTKCAVCHLPVRALAFVCAICSHGGHQECYQQYHMRRPPVPISSFLPVPAVVAEPVSGPAERPQRASDSGARVRASSIGREDGSDDGLSIRDGDDSMATSKVTETNVEGSTGGVAVMGHPCAAGCGHYCWATNEPLFASMLVGTVMA